MTYRVNWKDDDFGGVERDYSDLAPSYDRAREMAELIIAGGARDVVIWCPITNRSGRTLRYEPVEVKR